MRRRDTAKQAVTWAAALLAIAAAFACGFDRAGTLDDSATQPGADGGGPDSTANLLDATTSDGGGPVDGGAEGSADASCGDIATSPLNCGACGRSCLGAACSAGVCAPFVVTDLLDAPHGVAISGTTAYIAENNRGHIRMAPITGGANTLYFNTAQAPRAIAVATDRVFWVEQTKVRTKPFASTVIDLALTGTGGVGVLVDGAQVFYSSTVGMTVSAAALDLTGQSALASAQDAPVGLAVDATHVYWANTNGTIGRRPRNGSGAVENLISGEASPDSIAVDAAHIYWTASGAIRTATIGVWTASNLVTGEGRPRALVRDGSTLYWLDATNQTVRKVATTGGPALTLATGEPQQAYSFMTAIAFDATYVYWISSTLGTLKRVPK